MDFDAYVRTFNDQFWKASEVPQSLMKPLSSLCELPKRILLLAPHPDDECLMSGLALRAKREAQSKVFVVPYSYGSKVERREPRKKELETALFELQFDIVDPRSKGLDLLTSAELDQAFEEIKPDAVILPHSQDGHSTHIKAATAGLGSALRFCKIYSKELAIYESEFWQAMENPNLRVPLSADVVGKMGSALMKHRGEITRNPFHLFLPAFLMDQQRRGSEMATTPGSKVEIESPFAQLYRFQMIGESD